MTVALFAGLDWPGSPFSGPAPALHWSGTRPGKVSEQRLPPRKPERAAADGTSHEERPLQYGGAASRGDKFFFQHHLHRRHPGPACAVRRNAEMVRDPDAP